MEQADRARRGGGGAERLQPVLVDVRGQAQDRRDRAARRPPEPGAENGIERFLGLEGRRQEACVHDQRRAPCRVAMQPGERRAGRQGAADVEKIAVARATRPQHRVHEDDGVRLAPGDMRPGRRTMTRLIGRAGPGRSAAQRLVGARHAHGLRARRVVEPDHVVPDQVERADIERGRDRDLAAAGRQPFGEGDPGGAMHEAAIDMGRDDRHQRIGAHHPRRFDDHAHRRARRRPQRAVQGRTRMVVQGQHRRRPRVQRPLGTRPSSG